MPAWTYRLRRAHDFLVSRSLYPVLISSMLAAVLLAARLYRSHSIAYAGLAWNLFLAWIPYLSSLWADRLHRRHPRQWWYLVVPGALWLAFFPNAPYIITDLWYLYDSGVVPFWYDVGMVSLFALTGIFLAVFSLRIMHRLVRHHAGRIAGWLFVGSTLGLGALGIYLGRFLRWNSWDLLLHPRDVLADVAVRLINPLGHLQTFGFTFLFASILLVCYLALTSREPA